MQGIKKTRGFDANKQCCHFSVLPKTSLFLREQKLILQAVSEFPEAKEPEESLPARGGLQVWYELSHLGREAGPVLVFANPTFPPLEGGPRREAGGPALRGICMWSCNPLECL